MYTGVPILNAFKTSVCFRMGRFISTMLFVASIMVGLVMQVHGADPDKTFRNLSVSVPKMATAPVIDGIIGMDEWQGASMTPRMVQYDRDDRLTDGVSRFYFGYTDDALYVAWQIQRPKEAVRPKAVVVEPDTRFYRTDDAIEFSLNNRTASKNRTRSRDFYMIWNAIGTKFDRYRPVGFEHSPDMSWTGDWKTVSHHESELGWEGEGVFPLAMFAGADKPELGQHWFFQIGENRATPQPRVTLLGYQLGWKSVHDYPTMLFTGDEGVYARVLDSGAMQAKGRAGLTMELVNPSATARKVVPTLRYYKRKSSAIGGQPYLLMFDQSRDRSEDQQGTGKVVVGISDERLSQQIIDDNYDLIREQREPMVLDGGTRQKIDFTIPSAAGDYLIVYDVRYAAGEMPRGGRELIAGGPLPFLVPEPLAVVVRPFYLVDKSIDVTADLRYVPGWAARGAIDVTWTSTKDPETVLLSKSIDGEGLHKRLEFTIPIEGLEPGDYTLGMRVADVSGEVLIKREFDVVIPELPDWYTDKAGMSPVVPEPWVAMEVTQTDDRAIVSTLTGEYELRDSVLPATASVRSVFSEKREAVLRGPVTLTGMVDGEPVVWGGDVTIGDQADEIVHARSEAVAGDVVVRASSEIEFDGMTKITLDIEPVAGREPTMSDMTLSIPLTKALSDLYRPNRALLRPNQVDAPIGTLPMGVVKHDWRPNVWLGNSRRGLEWYAENWRGWKFDKKLANELIEVENGEDGATLKIHFVRTHPMRALVLDKPRQIVFGLMLTPARTINRESIRHAHSYYNEEGGKFKNVLEREAAAGVNAVEVWNHRPLQGWPDQTPERSAELRKLGDRLHAKGIKITPYAGWFISRKSQVYPTWGEEMIVEPRIYAGFSCENCCWNTPVIEAYIDQMAKSSVASGYDGFRMDAGWSASPCSSLKHRGYGSVCGWFDDDGDLQPSIPFFAAREAAKRGYRLYHGGEVRKGGLALHHIHGACRIAPIMSFMDATLSAEGAERNATNMKDFDLSFWRAQIMGDQWGQQVIYGPKSDRLGHNSRLAVGLLHRLTPRGKTLMSMKEQSYARAAKAAESVWKAEDWVQWLDEGTDFLGYWENGAYLNTGDTELYGSFHVRRGEKVLLALFNREQAPVERTSYIDLEALGFSGTVYAMDAVTKESIAIVDHSMTLDYHPESYRLIQISSEPFDNVMPTKISSNLAAELEPVHWPDVAGQTPEGWRVSDAARFAIVNGELVIDGDGDIASEMIGSIPSVPGKIYMFEVEARVDCDNGVYLGDSAEDDLFIVDMGEFYDRPRTIGSQNLPGRYELMRTYYTANSDAIPLRVMLNGHGKATVKRAGVYEVDRLP